MDPTLNPFAPGAGTRPPELAGRADIIAKCDTALARTLACRAAQGLLLTGLRGVGKTVLLNVIRDRAQELGFQVDLLEAPEGSALAPQLIPSLRQTLLRLSTREKARSFAEKSLRVLKSFQVSAKAGELEFGLKVSPELGTADSGLIDRDLADLLESVGEAARAGGTAVAILIDELQYLGSSDLSALIVAAHRTTQRQLPLIVMGAGLPSLPGLLGDAKSYAERLFLYPEIGPLGDTDARDALAEPVEKLGVTFSKPALDAVIDLTRGYPYFLQEWGSAVWDVSKGPKITLRDVNAAGEEATRRLDESFFRVRLNRVTDGEQRYLRAMAELGPGPYKSGDVAGGLGKNTNALGPVRDGLIRKGLIFSPKHGVSDFTVPLFDQYMRRSMPNF